MTKGYFPTPLYKFNAFEKENVYEPAEDTFLLLDALENEAPFLTQLNPSIILEIGTGSGVITTFLMKNFSLKDSIFFASDINPIASCNTLNTIAINDVNKMCHEILIDNLAQSFLPRLSNQVDLVLFNPPYVTTDEENDTILSKAWNGGINGNCIIDKSIEVISTLLSSKGVAYIILVNENQPFKFINRLNLVYHINAHIILRRQALNEHLFIIKFWK